ncbi:hypothetical protein TRFO_32688 [Tritrichomonas foetus]|uniref:Uncharacterized protein n=1 Tax=Tritrichomonas foetus TaxID=1144522 RepID=A0A1J4JNB9_9EUKA|nr:hypothetical protein TRFO_32688 [Tritrichomonas foetus]|eukprot:OHT00623.1 hypothetical protein TRFO_32688 [Tritrichomonas foetus]
MEQSSLQYTAKAIEEAAISMSNGPIELQQAASAFILEWQETPNCEKLAFSILGNSNNQFTCYICCVVIYNVIKDHYLNFSLDYQKQCQQEVINHISNQKHSYIVIQKLNSISILMGLLSWSSFWENFPMILYPQINFNHRGLVDLIQQTAFEIENSNFIDGKCRSSLIQLYNSHILTFFPMIFEHLMNVDEIDLIYSVLASLIYIAPVELFDNNFMIEFYQNSLHNEFQIQQLCLSFFTQILNQRSYLSSLLTKTADFVISYYMSLGANQVTFFDEKHYEFLLAFLKNSPILLKTNNVNDISLLFTYTLANKEMVAKNCYAFFDLWTRLVQNKDFSPILEGLTFDHFYQLLNIIEVGANEYGIIKSSKFKNFYCKMFLLFPNQILGIIHNANIDLNIVYLFCGSTWKVLSQHKETLYHLLFDCVFQNGVNTCDSLYFAMSSYILNDNNLDKFTVITNYCIKVIQSNMYYLPAVFALHSLVKTNHIFFKDLCLSLSTFVFENINNLINHDLFLQYFEIICQSIHKNMLVLHQIEVFVKTTINSNGLNIKTHFEIWECLSIKKFLSSAFLPYFLNLRSLLIQEWMHDEELMKHYFELISLFSIKLKQRCIEEILTLIRCIYDKFELYEYLFMLIGKYRHHVQEFEVYIDEFLKILIIPFLSQGCISESFIFMISQFSIDIVSNLSLLSYLLVSVRDTKCEITNASVECLKILILHLKPDDCSLFFQNYRRCILSSIFSCLLDMLHYDSLTKIATLLECIFIKSQDDPLFSIEFNDEILIYTDGKPFEVINLFQNLMIFAVTKQSILFKQNLKDMIINLNRMTPKGIKIIEDERCSDTDLNVLLEDNHNNETEAVIIGINDLSIS